jgi:hypothetical protein
VRLRRAITVGLLSAALLPVAKVGAEQGGADPIDGASCEIGMARTTDAHRLRFSTKCNFEQSSIRLHPDGVLDRVDPTLRVTGDADVDDEFGCRQRGEEVALCQGRAGSGAKVVGRLATMRAGCGLATKVRVIGGVDCDQGDVCPDIAFIVRQRIAEPRGC